MTIIICKNNNKFYSSIWINIENLPQILCDLGKDEKNRTEAANESDIEGLEENVNRLENFRQVA